MSCVGEKKSPPVGEDFFLLYIRLVEQITDRELDAVGRSRAQIVLSG